MDRGKKLALLGRDKYILSMQHDNIATLDGKYRLKMLNTVGRFYRADRVNSRS